MQPRSGNARHRPCGRHPGQHPVGSPKATQAPLTRRHPTCPDRTDPPGRRHGPRPRLSDWPLEPSVPLDQANVPIRDWRDAPPRPSKPAVKVVPGRKQGCGASAPVPARAPDDPPDRGKDPLRRSSPDRSPGNRSDAHPPWEGRRPTDDPAHPGFRCRSWNGSIPAHAVPGMSMHIPAPAPSFLCAGSGS